MKKISNKKKETRKIIFLIIAILIVLFSEIATLFDTVRGIFGI